MSKISTINPATNEVIASYDLMTHSDVSDIIDASHHCYLEYRRSPFAYRSKLLQNVAALLEDRIEQLAAMMTAEMGKPIKSAKAEVKKCAWVCRYYAEQGKDFLADELVDTGVTKSLICYRPLGLVLAVMPWNYPLWQVFRFAAPALMAGNVCLLKHASNVPGCALLIEQVLADAGFPKSAFRTLICSSSQMGAILANTKVKAATLTGSEAAGSAVAATAGGKIKKTVLELGGSDPYLVLEDADLEHAAEQCMISRLLNAGQSCIGAKRFIITAEIYDEWLEIFVNKMKHATMGDPLQEVDLGPMARHDLRDEVHQQVLQSIAKGAELVLGGIIPDLPGAYYPPTILTNVTKGQPAYDDEIFGPVASVIKVADEQAAIAAANDTDFGLGACVFTKDLARGERIAKDEIEAGACFVNHFVKSDPRLPFGGIKTSGYGRELSHFGIREFVNIKTLSIL